MDWIEFQFLDGVIHVHGGKNPSEWELKEYVFLKISE